MKVTITGTPTGDCECFCFEVTEAEYRRIKGEEAYQQELKYREEDALLRQAGLEPGEVGCPPVERVWRIYPDDLLACLGVAREEPVTLEIGVV